MKSEANKGEQAILEVERKLFKAIMTKDDVTLGKIVGNDFVFRAPGQPEMGKAEFIKSVKSFPIEILEVWSDDMKANVYGDFALLTGVQKARTRDKDGKELLSAGAFSDVFVKREGQWILVLAYNVELPNQNPQ